MAGEPDSCDIGVTASPAGSVVFIFHVSRILLQRRRLDSHVGVDWTPVNDDVDRRSIPLPLSGFSPANLDWRSNSSMDAFRRQLQSYFDPDKTLNFPWTQIIQLAAQRVNQFVAQVGDLEPAEYIETVRPNYLVRPLWPASKRPTVWYGQGETGKGQMAIAAGLALCYGGNLAGLRGKLLDRGVVYVDYEDDFEEFSVRVSRLVNGQNLEVPPNLRRFDPRGRLFVDIVEQLKAKITAAGGADGVIIDSALPATGGDANAPEPVGAFFNALAWLNMPVLVIAHETKLGNDAFPFGSQLWRTEACMTVNFQASPEAQKDKAGHWVRDLLLRCTKANNVRRFAPLAFQLVFTDDAAPAGGRSTLPLAASGSAPKREEEEKTIEAKPGIKVGQTDLSNAAKRAPSGRLLAANDSDESGGFRPDEGRAEVSPPGTLESDSGNAEPSKAKPREAPTVRSQADSNDGPSPGMALGPPSASEAASSGQAGLRSDEARAIPTARPQPSSTTRLSSTWIRQIEPSRVGLELQSKLPALAHLTAHLRENPGSTVKQLVDDTGLSRGAVIRQLAGNPSLFASQGGAKGRSQEATWTLIQGGKA